MKPPEKSNFIYLKDIEFLGRYFKPQRRKFINKKNKLQSILHMCSQWSS